MRSIGEAVSRIRVGVGRPSERGERKREDALDSLRRHAPLPPCINII